MFFRIIFLFLMYLPYTFASIILNDTTNKYADFSIAYHYDETSKLGINQISQIPFTQTIPSQFALGYKTGTAWFKITVENKSHNSAFVLSFTEPFWATFDLYEPTPTGWIHHKNGLLTPLKNRQIQDTDPSFMLHIPTAETKTYFIKGQTVNSQIGAFNLYPEKEFFRPSRLTLKTFYPFYSGILFIIIILNLFLLIEMRERIYAYYIGYVSAFFIFVCMFSASYLYFGFAPWNEGLHVVGTVVLAFMALFSGSFLELEKYFPKMNQMFKFFTIIFFIFGILIHFNAPYSTHTFNILSALFIATLLIMVIKTWNLGKIKMRYYLIALMIYMPAMGLMVLTFNAQIDNTNFTRYSFLIGALIEIIFFALILANRFHAAKNDKIHYQNELLIEKHKQHEKLENEISRQRIELKEKNAILFHQSRHAAMGEMITMIAHQWRQPLNTLSLINHNFYIKHKLDQCDEESFEQMHNQFNEHLQFMSKTIDDFRNYYKNDITKHLESPQEMAELALRLSEVFLNYAKIKTELLVNTNQKVNVAKNEIIQVLMNLIKNAHDAIIEQNVQSGKITIAVEQSEKSVEIRVYDNGGGVPDKIASKIFEPYFSTKSETGTGLGLYMSKSIIEEHCDGILSFHNTAMGSCFTITLPSPY